MYRIEHPDGRIVTKHKHFERFYVKYPNFEDDELERFETESRKEAEEALEATNRNWTGFRIVEV